MVTIGAVLDDAVARCILRQAYATHMSASDLANGCGVSEPTIYRRLETLREHDFVVERTHPDARGHHYQEYRTNLRRLTVEITDEGFDVRVGRREPAADRFTRLIEGL